MDSLRVYIGWDGREAEAWRVAAASLRAHASGPIDIIPLKLIKLQQQMMLWREFEERDGKIWDRVSKAFCSTEFAISRFFVPLLAHSGWALFVDADVVFCDDVANLFALADPKYAVMCVQHDYLPTPSAIKMDGQKQTAYQRKNWSSVALWNADHPSNARLHLGVLNNTPGRDLHAFNWLGDDEIGRLPARWNWLVGEQERPQDPGIAHYTLGTPDMIGDANCPHPDIWREAARLWTK